MSARIAYRWGLAAVLCLPVMAVGQAPRNDLIDHNKAMLKVAADRLEGQVSDALTEARRVAANNPAKAASVLKGALSQLESDTALSEARRASLVRTVKERLQALQANATPEKAPRTDPTKDADQRALARSLELVEKLQRDGKTAEAAKLANELAKSNPDNPAVQAALRTTHISDNVAGRNGNRTEIEKRALGTLATVDATAVPPAGDIEIPKDWFKRMEKRKDVNQPVLTAKEQAIVKALSSTIKPEYKDVTLFDVLDDLATKLNVTFVLDKSSLADAGVTSDTQVTLVLPRGVTARTAVRKMLADVGLAYVIKNETIQVVSDAKAKEMMVTRTYYIGNLLAGGMFNDAGIRFNPWLDQIQVLQNVKSVMDLIQGSVDPSSWQANGGRGTINFYAPTMSVIIRQSAEVHGMLGSYSK